VDVSVDLTLHSEKACDRATVVVANHPSMLDAMLLMTVYPNAVCIMKQSLMRLPIISGFASLARYIPQADTPELLSAACGVLREGGSIVIFPEGTRSPKGSLGELKRGAARIAVEEGVPIDVFALSMDPVVLGREASWWKPPGERVRYRAVRIESGLTASDASLRGNPDEARAEAVRLTRSIEICLRNSLSCPRDEVVAGDL
jgi:1-acyl-sn-glycerol-3-phosphate acyltransferase